MGWAISASLTPPVSDVLDAGAPIVSNVLASEAPSQTCAPEVAPQHETLHNPRPWNFTTESRDEHISVCQTPTHTSLRAHKLAGLTATERSDIQDERNTHS